ncbi:MAG TPA: SDR family NAD(P)-dependent oxidoreductase [Solirubrobacteraceae bacterium]|jgi:2-hydroxycyclohexanecarboxyl-CoA dehydrogenase|nr:SDR family NAD(P)-dependent oxidoreductase [Solirubrobacteraceae bacterium]
MAEGTQAGATLAGRVALVTGATGGIGAAISRALAAAGARVAVSDLAGEGCAELAGEIGGVPVALDVTSGASVAEAVAETGRALGRISILVNNAGIDHFGRFSDGDEALWERLWAVNLRGVLAVTRATLPDLRDGGGAIVNVASEAGRVGGHSQAVYSATKGGVIAFGKALAREEARHGITVNAVAPGPVETPMMRAAEAKMGEERTQAALRAIPAGRAGTPGDVAAAVVFLASPAAAYTTGATLPVSGGLAMI